MTVAGCVVWELTGQMSAWCLFLSVKWIWLFTVWSTGPVMCWWTVCHNATQRSQCKSHWLTVPEVFILTLWWDDITLLHQPEHRVTVCCSVNRVTWIQLSFHPISRKKYLKCCVPRCTLGSGTVCVCVCTRPCGVCMHTSQMSQLTGSVAERQPGQMTFF